MWPLDCCGRGLRKSEISMYRKIQQLVFRIKKNEKGGCVHIQVTHNYFQTIYKSTFHTLGDL